LVVTRGLAARGRVGDHLGEHRVEAGSHDRAGLDARVPAHRRRGRRREGGERARGGQEVARRVLGVEPHLDRRSLEADVVLPVAERLAGGDAELVAHQVAAGHHLGDGVLHLEARVHLQEEELARGVVDQELHRARRAVAELAAQPQRRLAHRAAQVGGDAGRGRLLHDLLVAALDRALALAQMHEVPVGVAEDLDLHVARARDVALEEDAVVAEAAQRLALGGRERVGEPVRRRDHPHALAPAPRRGLHEQRVAQAVGVGGVLGAGQRRHLGLLGQGLGGDLVAHALDGVGAGPDPREARLRDARREARVLREEAVAGVHGAGAGGRRGREHGVGVEVGGREAHGLVRIADVGRVGVGVHVDGDAAQAHVPGAAEDAAGDLPPVGDEQGVEAHSRNTP